MRYVDNSKVSSYNALLSTESRPNGPLFARYKDIVVLAYILEAGVEHGSVAETPNNGGLNFQETADYSYWTDGVAAIRVQELLNLGERVTVVSGHVTQNNPPSLDLLRFTERMTVQLVRARNAVTVQDSLTLASNVEFKRIKPGTHQLQVSETIGIGLSLSRAIVDTLTFSEQTSFYVPNVNWHNPGTYVPVPVGHLQLADLTGSAGTITIRTPKLGDTEKYLQTRIQRNTRGGDLEVFNDPMWPNADIFHFEFEYLTGTEAAVFLTFLSNTLGRHLRLTDHYNRQLTGFVITPEESILQPKVHGFEAKFDFQIKEG